MSINTLSYERINSLLKISRLELRKPIQIKELVKSIDISRANFSHIQQMLINNELAEIREVGIGNAKTIHINNKKLNNFIRTQELVKNILAWNKYIKYLTIK